MQLKMPNDGFLSHSVSITRIPELPIYTRSTRLKTIYRRNDYRKALHTVEQIAVFRTVPSRKSAEISQTTLPRSTKCSNQTLLRKMKQLHKGGRTKRRYSKSRHTTQPLLKSSTSNQLGRTHYSRLCHPRHTPPHNTTIATDTRRRRPYTQIPTSGNPIRATSTPDLNDIPLRYSRVTATVTADCDAPPS